MSEKASFTNGFCSLKLIWGTRQNSSCVRTQSDVALIVGLLHDVGIF